MALLFVSEKLLMIGMTIWFVALRTSLEEEGLANTYDNSRIDKS